MACFYNIHQKRVYTGQYYRIYAKYFKELLSATVDNKNVQTYNINADWLDDGHSQFKLYETDEYPRVMIFKINEQKIPVPLQTDNRSISNKLYLICPYCGKQRQHLFVTKYSFKCRDCANLHYLSQSESKPDRLARRIRKIRAQVWPNNFPDRDNLFDQSYYWPKPKSWHYSRFEKIRAQLLKLETEYWQLHTDKLNRMFGEYTTFY